MTEFINHIATWLFFHQLLIVFYMASCLICHVAIENVFSKRELPIGSKVILRIFCFIPVINTGYAAMVILAWIIGFFRKKRKPTL